MAGRSFTKARHEAEQRRLAEATELPTPARDHPIPYSDDLCSEVMELAAKGMTDVEIAAHWCIEEATFKEWEEAYPSFAEAVRRARTRAKAWWTRQPRLALLEKDNRFPAGAWSQQMSALFPEYDKKAPAVVIDVSKFVQVTYQLPELPQQQMVGGPKPLTINDAAQLLASLTALEGPSEASPDAATAPDPRPDPDPV